MARNKHDFINACPEAVAFSVIVIWTAMMTTAFVDGRIFAHKIVAWVLFVLAVLILYGLLWFIAGREPKRGIMPRAPGFKAEVLLPPKMSPGYIWALRNRSTEVDLMFDIVWLAVSGLLGIRMIRKKSKGSTDQFTLFKKEDVNHPETKRNFQRQLQDKLFSDGEEITWSMRRFVHYDAKLSDARGWLTQYYEHLAKKEMWTSNVWISSAALLPVLIFCEWLTRSVCNTSFFMVSMIEFTCLLLLVMFVCACIGVKNGWHDIFKKDFHMVTGGMVKIIGGLGGAIFFIFVGLMMFVEPVSSSISSIEQIEGYFITLPIKRAMLALPQFDFVLFIGILVIPTIIVLFSFRLMPCYKKNTVKQLDEIEHLKEYLRTVKPESLEDAPRMFEMLLPFSIALDMENEWIQRLQPVLQQSDYIPTFVSLDRAYSNISLTEMVKYIKDEIYNEQRIPSE
jgi:hypothetical protein